MFGEQNTIYTTLIFSTVESVKICMLAIIIVMLYLQHKRLISLEKKLKTLI